MAMSGQGIPPASVKYFFGRISRDEAEQMLQQGGLREGLYLLRESMTTAGNYALSICHQIKIHHYSIERQPDNTVMIQDGKKFIGPVELVQHHEREKDGFLTRPTVPCERPAGQQPMAWPYITYQDLEKEIIARAESMGFRDAKLVNALGPQRQHFISLIAKDFHREQSWFHGRISRDEADNIMAQAGHQDGKFLVRERDDRSYALSLSYRSNTKHYKIDRHKVQQQEKLAIEEGQRFDNLLDMIGHYHNKTDGLLCKLTMPCCRKNWSRSTRFIADRNPAYGSLPVDHAGTSRVDAPTSASPLRSRGPERGAAPAPPPLRSSFKASTRFEELLRQPEVAKCGLLGNQRILVNDWDDGNDFQDGRRSSASQQASRGWAAGDYEPEEEHQKVYDAVPRTEDVFKVNRQDIELQHQLGSGNFGSVMRGTYKRGDYEIPVAVKTLKQEEVPNAEGEIMKEAKTMAGLEHRNIVRLIGVCRAETIMLVMELAGLGQLNKYLKTHHAIIDKIKVIELMFQVAEGMAYLESKNFVHRDLAARNVLLVNEQFAKISDFGMSKALGLGSAYYQCEKAGRWPLKWYAPECIYFFKFDSKSDVWSYGVTLWEALSYGAKPYKGLRGQQILELIECGRRLDRPDICPPGIYEIMMRCWKYDKHERPNFKEIVELLRKFRV